MPKTLFFFTAFLFSLYGLCAQETEPPVPCTLALPQVASCFVNPEEQPLLLIRTAGSLDKANYKQQADAQLLKFLYQNFRSPPLSRTSCISGTIVISFTIQANGLIDKESIRCVRDIGGDLGAEGIRLINLMADLGWQWIPGKQYGVPVPTRFNVPIRIHLD